MTVLVTGATGTVGSEVTAQLTAHGIEVRALIRHAADARVPAGVRTVEGELTDVEAMRAALDGVSGLFLLSPVTPEELTGTLLTLDLADRAGVRAIAYLSVIHADRFTEPPHFAAKGAAERMITDRGLPVTMLRPGYYDQNDLELRDALTGDGVYTPPLGRAGVLAVDVRDLAAVGVAALRERLDATSSLPPETLDVVAPELLTAETIAATWADLLARPVHYGGDDLDGFESSMAEAGAPPWMAHDMRLMMARFEVDGMAAAPGTDERLRALLGRPMRSYREFAADAVSAWAAAA
ncbi:NAD(P)H-binding protein [Actinomycetospora endophytica]|uniref:NAD(P)H-binding protein n=1 Tax=Actinomycetospora endophytica TaxID=2291215 RepID=A0ABS8P166_9PSEU|nr:NAD(P)H-binding protein [Actinomycetospora endophytica]MCD2191839.1 NAD(P)H-binding protein [Actinomycetospora endophytica]